MVPEVGLEPTRREAGDFESPMYTNFITQAKALKLYLALQSYLKKTKYLCKTKPISSYLLYVFLTLLVTNVIEQAHNYQSKKLCKSLQGF